MISHSCAVPAQQLETRIIAGNHIEISQRTGMYEHLMRSIFWFAAFLLSRRGPLMLARKEGEKVRKIQTQDVN